MAPNTLGDGTGCDNMTAIIVQFKRDVSAKKEPMARKRSASEGESPEEGGLKRLRSTHDGDKPTQAPIVDTSS